MLPLPKITKKRALFAVGIILCGCLVAYYFISSQPRGHEPPLIPKETEVAKQDAKIKITPNTDLVQKLIYTKCNDEEVFRTKPADNLIGLNYQQFQKVYSGWTIHKFDNLEVEMSLKVDSYCREHANNMFIGIKDGYVAVFYGKPGPKALLKEVTKIPVSKLVQEDLDELKRGIVVHSREELLRTLEGMQSR
ncbi:hypothetical protein TcarDRAFT_0417 [Thermosinus carboxydivorans Nor1]|uniref:Bypass of forespore C C-terminal domain-containing protein n=1 Tax=Thermosinus carboxydivorans Nor1 TaxID=401526 RepID=A1HT73_9FIRM|nr:BofC C-terminal domain-containing protein [Thermosinus carboxydivorans]EAX46752.1 hypothetical protein TcarDRAFT_0417 [Thermosinus carboxydivorans Nor1]